MASSRIMVVSAVALTLVILLLLDQPTGTEAGYGKHGGHGKAGGTACIVKGSYCSCHYCKCEKGHIHCGHKHGYGKKFCYGSMEGQYCHCDYCKCKHGYGSKGYGKCH